MKQRLNLNIFAAILVGIFAVGMMSGNAGAIPSFVMPNARLGDTVDSVKASLKNAGVSFKELHADVPQQYAEGLVRSNLLVMLNKAAARHTLLKDPATRNITFIDATKGSQHLTFAFAEDKLEAVLVRSSVSVDRLVGGRDNAFTKRRLDPVRNFLQQYKQQCSIRPNDTGVRNHFSYAGSCGREKVYVSYHPELNEYRVLFHKR